MQPAVDEYAPSRPSWIAFVVTLLFSACSRPADPQPAAQANDASLPDIVIVTLDTTRADHLGLYGYFRDTTPNLDRLATESLVFERHIVAMATTLPSHVSLFTMTQPDEHGITANFSTDGQRFVPSNELVPLAAFAQQAGMQTGGFVSSSPVRHGSGLEHGFTHYDSPEELQRPADQTTDRALAWLAQQSDARPLLLWVHYFDPHIPYTAPQRHGLDADDRARRQAMMKVLHVPATLEKRGDTPHDIGSRIDAYDDELRFMDEHLGRLLAALRARPRWSRTLLVVAGDHGESLGDHALLGHGALWGEQLRAPLVVRIPGRAAGRIEGVISTVDVLPTLLAQCELPGEREWLRQASGRDVLHGAPERPALSRSTERKRLKLGHEIERALSTASWRYVRSDAGAERLYDLARDPCELENVAAVHTDVVAELRRALAEQQALHEGGTKHRRATLGAPLSPAELQQLRALGYVDDDAPTPTAR